MAAPTASLSMNTQKITNVVDPTSAQDASTKAYVDAQVNALVDGAPGTLNTLNEIATAISSGGSFESTVVLKSGSTMTGALTLSGAPSSDLHAATKAYVDTVAGSATAAAASAASAATTYDNFDDRYLGDKATAPTVDNDGNTLLVGAMYWNSALNAMYVWSGSAWVQIATTTTYTAPTLGSTSIASGATVTNVNGLTINSTTIPTSATLVKTTDNLSVLASTTSAELETLISDNTGTGALVFANSPNLSQISVSTINSPSPSTGSSLYPSISSGAAVYLSNQTTGTLDIAGANNRTGTLSIANGTTSTVTINVANGVTASGNTKTINIGTAGASGSTTAITLGGTAGTSNITLNGNLTATPAQGAVATAATGVGYMGIPPSSANTTGSYTVGAADAGEHIYSTGTRTITIPANSTLALPIGTTITFIAATGATVTIAITTDTLLLAGPGTTGSRTLAPFGMATAVKITATSWIISGNGLS
jgi:hypothetical protein